MKTIDEADGPKLPMEDLRPDIFDFYAGRCVPGSLAYCECDAGPRHLVGIVPGTDDVRIHFYVDLKAHVVTVLHIHDGPDMGAL